MIEVYKIPLGEEGLAKIPKLERTLLLALGHLANEINILTKVFYWSANTKSEGELDKLGSNAQAMLFGRLLCGKLFEGWQLLQSAYYGSKLSKEYNDLLEDEVKEALRQLGRYFGKENAISKTRNGFAFHFSPEKIARCFEAGGRSDPLDMYLSDSNANSLYSFSETIVNQAMLQAIDPDDPQAAINTLISETSRITALFNQVIAGCMVMAIQRHLGEDLEALGAETLKLEKVAIFEDVELPFFVSERADDSAS